jgi:hypothetical protein
LQLAADGIIVFPLVRTQTVSAIFESVSGVGKITTAFIAQSIQRAVTENATEGFGICSGVAGEILACLMLEKIIVRHRLFLTIVYMDYTISILYATVSCVNILISGQIIICV